MPVAVVRDGELGVLVPGGVAGYPRGIKMAPRPKRYPKTGHPTAGPQRDGVRNLLWPSLTVGTGRGAVGLIARSVMR